MSVPPQTAPPPRMVNLCQATQTTIIAPNPMLQGALLMQQMQGTNLDYCIKKALWKRINTRFTKAVEVAISFLKLLLKATHD